MYEDRLSYAIKKITNILKSNEIPNASYLLYNDYIMIYLYDTILYFYKIKDIEYIDNNPISFKLVIDENKQVLPFDVNNMAESSLLLKTFNTYINIPLSNTLIAEYTNLQDNSDFSNLLALKAADGMKLFKLPNNELYSISYIPVFSGFPALVKNDTIDIKVYKDYIEGYSVVEYTVYKNKLKDNYKMYFRILNL